MPEIKVRVPEARREMTQVTLHGQTLLDDFGWMRDKSSPEVIAYLQAENAYTAAAMEGTEELQATLYAEMLSHIKETDESVPYRYRGWWYSTRTVEGSQYAIHCRRAAAADGSLDESAAEVVLLDVNVLAEKQALHVRRHDRDQPGRLADGVYDRQHRFPAVHAAPARSAQRRGVDGHGGARGIGDVGPAMARRSSTRPRTSDEAAGPAVAACAGAGDELGCAGS